MKHEQANIEFSERRQMVEVVILNVRYLSFAPTLTFAHRLFMAAEIFALPARAKMKRAAFLPPLGAS